MNKKGLGLFVVVALQIAWMAGTAISKEMNLRSDTTVLLETMPVDPRDLLRGDFVILNYKISNVPPVEGVKPGTALGRDVYVTLEKSGKFHVATAASLTSPQPGPGQIVVRATMDESWGRVTLRYGIEKYYVREGTGNPRGVVTVECVVAKNGGLQIKDVFVDGRPYAKAMRGL